MKQNLFDAISGITPKKRKTRFSKKQYNDAFFADRTGLQSKHTSLELSLDSKRWNSLIFVVLLLMFFFVLLAKSYNLQVIRGEENATLAEGNRVRVTNISAERGLITDRNGEILVRNKPAFSLELDPSLCQECLLQVEKMTQEFDLNVNLSRISTDIGLGKERILIASDLTKEEIIPIESSFSRFDAFSIAVSPRRDYVYGPSLAHLVGYIGFADTLQPVIEGKVGVEASYNDVISGVDGGEIVQVNSLGQKVAVLSEKHSIPGNDVQLYVDSGLQGLAYELLKDKVSNTSATAGVVVAQDPTNGGVLALVSYPSFDPNQLVSGLTQQEYDALSNDPSFPFFNRVVAAGYPPASTFKMVMAAALLEEEILDPFYQITDNGFIQVGSFIFKNWRVGGHGLVDLKRALQVSNDTYFYTVGGGYGGVDGLGISNIFKWARLFGYGKSTGIDIPGEIEGFMPDGKYKDWYLGDTYITSIGQGDTLATPLQVNNMATYFANGGVLYEPGVVKSINGSKSKPNVLRKNLIDEESYDLIREGWQVSVEPGGTGYPFFDFPTKSGVTVAGKTGTAEFGAFDNEDTHAWFTVFGPLTYEDDSKPITLTVFLEEGGSGSDDAAPIARKLFDYWFLSQD